MAAEFFNRLIGEITVKEINGEIIITGGGLHKVHEDIADYFKTTRVYKNLVNTFGRTKITLFSFFALDFEYVLRLLSNQSKTRWGKRNYLKLIEELKENTWLGKIEKHSPDIFKMEHLKDIKYTLLPHQQSFIEYYNRILPRYKLKGLLFAGEPGSGKTLTAISIAKVFEAENVIIISPKNAVFRVWQNSIENLILTKETCWVKASGLPMPSPEQCKWFVFHYEALEEALVLAEQLKNKKVVYIADECLDENTEVLTSNGFKLIKDVTVDDLVLQYNKDGTNSWVHPLRTVVSESKEAHHYIHQKWEQIVTPNHRMVYWKCPGRQEFRPWTLETSYSKDIKSLPFTRTIVAGLLKNDSHVRSLTDVERLLIAVQADGSINLVSEIQDMVKIDFHIAKERKIERLISLFNATGFSWTEYPSVRSIRRFLVKIPFSALPNGDEFRKNPKLIKLFSSWIDLTNTCSNWSKEFIDELMNWDGHITKDNIPIKYYSSIVKENVEYAQIIAVNAGYRINKAVQVDNRSETYSDVHRLWIYNYDTVSNNTCVKKVITYDEPKKFYCLTVPSGMFYVRYNSKISVTGNCHFLNDVKSNRTERFIRLARMLPNSIYVGLSGTPMKALGQEAIPLFRVIDPMFTDACVDKFKKIYGKDAKKATEILANRLGIVMYKAELPKDKVGKPIEHQLNISVPNSDMFTLPFIKNQMQDFILERTKFYKENYKNFREQFDNAMRIFEKTILPKLDMKAHVDYETYKEYLNEFIVDGYDPKLSPPKALFCNHYEKTYIEPNLDNFTRKQFRNSKSVVKYVNLKIRGECLGTVLSRARTNCNKALLEHIDFPSLIDNAEKKTLIFTSYVEVVEECQKLLTNIGYKPIVVYADTNKELTKIVEKFDKDENINPLIATYQSLSTAVPLTMANRVILLNAPFRIHEKEQTIARANRIGQDKTVDVYNVFLDTGNVPNISTRSNEILEWSKEQVNAIMGFENDINVGIEDINEINIDIEF